MLRMTAPDRRLRRDRRRVRMARTTGRLRRPVKRSSPTSPVYRAGHRSRMIPLLAVETSSRLSECDTVFELPQMCGFRLHRVDKQWASASAAQYSKRSNVTSPEQGVRPPWLVTADDRPQDILRHCLHNGPSPTARTG